jgi:hypothetical protein
VNPALTSVQYFRTAAEAFSAPQGQLASIRAGSAAALAALGADPIDRWV